MDQSNLESFIDKKFNSFLSDVFFWMIERDKCKRIIMKSEIHSRYGASKSLFWTTVMHILTGKYDSHLDIDHQDIIYPFIEEDELINI